MNNGRQVRTDIPFVTDHRARATTCYWPRVKAAPVAQRSRWRVWLARIGFGLLIALFLVGMACLAAIMALPSPAETIFTH